MQTFKTLIVVVWVLAVLVPIATGLGEDDRWMLLIPILIAGWLYGYWRSSRAGWLPGTNAGQHLSNMPVVITSHDGEYWDEVFRRHDELFERMQEMSMKEMNEMDESGPGSALSVATSTAAGDRSADDFSSARFDDFDHSSAFDGGLFDGFDHSSAFDGFDHSSPRFDVMER